MAAGETPLTIKSREFWLIETLKKVEMYLLIGFMTQYYHARSWKLMGMGVSFINCRVIS